MRIIHRPKQSGKTTGLIKLMSSDKNLVYVAATRRKAVDAERQARAMATEVHHEISRTRFVSAEEAARWRWPHETRFLVDELEDVLQKLLGSHPVELATFTGTSERFFEGEAI